MLLTAAIVTSGDSPIDTSQLGLFTIFYDVTDTAGNAAATKQRVVEVRATSSKCAQDGCCLRAAALVVFAFFPPPLPRERYDLTVRSANQAKLNQEKRRHRFTKLHSVSKSLMRKQVVADGGVCTPTPAPAPADTEPPQITILGKQLKKFNQIPRCSEYTDAGATAFDDTDGDISDLIVTGGDFPLDTSVLGLYTITFDVTDSSGNAAKTKKRFLEVVEDNSVCAPTPAPTPAPEVEYRRAVWRCRSESQRASNRKPSDWHILVMWNSSSSSSNNGMMAGVCLENMNDPHSYPLSFFILVSIIC